MCSLQTSTGTRLMFLVVEKMGATAEDDELLLVFWRLVGGAVGEPPVLFAEDIFKKICQKWSKIDTEGQEVWGVGVLHRADIGGFPQMTIFHHFPPKLGGLCVKMPF
jgi:hypothetical protein